MRFRLIAIAIIVVIVYFVITRYKPEPSALPPAPMAIINGTRDRLTPFRFTLETAPPAPRFTAPILLKVHVIDATSQPADGVEIKADVSMSGMDHGSQHLTLTGRGNGDYEGEVNLEMPGSWDVDLTANKDGKSRQQKLSIEVGG
jgi:hypothetical protein